MLRSAKEIIGYKIYAEDADVGKCEDLLLDDQWWTIRHMVADTGEWLVKHLVLVSPLMIKTPDWETRRVILNITKEKLGQCPAPEKDEPVSREYEKNIYQYYNYPYYWVVDAGLWGPTSHESIADDPGFIREQVKKESSTENDKGNHLRSFKELVGYDIKAEDGEIGHVQDFIFDDETWVLRYLIVDTRNWLPGGKKVMLSLNWAKSVSWSDAYFEVDLTKDQIENAPEFDPETPVNVEYETQLYDFFGRPLKTNIDKQL